MSITKITTPELLDFPNDSTSSTNTSGTVIPKGYTAACTFPDSVTNLALYTMDGNADDSCGSLNLTNTNSVPFVTSSPWGGSYQSADFDPSASPDEYLTIASGLGSVADRTRSLWIYLDAIPSVFATVLYIGSTAFPNQNYEVLSVSSATTGHVRFQSRYSTSTDAAIESLSALSTSTWYHVAWVYQGTSIYLYVNGALQGSTTNTVTDTSSYPAFFGAWHNGSTEFDGKIAQVRFYNQALNGDQIAKLYNENLTTYYRPTTNLNAGEFRYNEQLGYVEYYDGSTWFQIADEYISGQPTTCICNYPITGTALYQLNDNANDTCGSYNGTESNMTWGTGKFGNCGIFNGSSSYITLPNSIEQPMISAQQFGVSMWFNIDALPTGGDKDYLISLYQEGYLDIRIEASGVIQGQVAEETSGTNRAAMSSTGVISATTWHHVVFTGETNNLVLYVDNSSVATQSTWNGTFFHSTAGCCIGARNNGGTDFFDGKIDQLRIFPSALTSTQVSELYNEVVCN